MNSHQRETQKIKDSILEPFLGGLNLLSRAYCYAVDTGSDLWDFAIEIDLLCSLGLTASDFRWLVRKGLVAHRREVTLEEDDGRAFRPTGDLKFPETTCFILTDAGVSIACASCPPLAAAASPCSFSSDEENLSVTINRNFSDNGKGPKGKPSMPTWDSERRELRINGTTVKHFKWTAVNQEAILATFEEESWPTRIDDPLSPKPEQDPKRRLSDTIKCLNRKQKNKLIHFRGDGTGEAVTWELVGQNGSDDELSG